MNQQLIPLEPKDMSQNDNYLRLASKYYKARNNDDEFASKYINDQTLKAVFDILLKISYGLFVIGVLLTLQTQAGNQQKFMDYLQTSRSQIFQVILLLLGVVILSALKVVKHDNKVSPSAKKILNFIVDILRTVLYVLSLVFVQPFVYDNSETFLTASFWIFVIATVLFFGRKVVKWAYFLVDKKGKLVLDPWFNSDVKNLQNIATLAQIAEEMLKKEVKGGLLQKDIGSNQKQQLLKKMQEKFMANLEEKNRLLIEMENLFQDKD